MTKTDHKVIHLKDVEQPIRITSTTFKNELGKQSSKQFALDIPNSSKEGSPEIKKKIFTTMTTS